MNQLMPGIGLDDFDLFFRVAKLKSLRECARQLKTTPGAVSKAIKRLEQKLDKTLMQRSVSGVVLTSDGHDFMAVAERVLALTAELSGESRKGKTERVWGIGSLSFISSRLLPDVLDEVCALRPRTRFRIVEFTHNQIVAQGLQGAFEMAVHIGALEWTRLWSSHELGPLRWGLYANAKHPLTKLKTVRSSDVVKYPFVMPTGWSTQGFMRGEDHCPIPWGVRSAGHESTTGETALEIVRSTNQLVFVPVILGERSALGGLVKEIKVADWPLIEKTIYLSVRDDVVSSGLLEHVSRLLKDRLRKQGE